MKLTNFWGQCWDLLSLIFSSPLILSLFVISILLFCFLFLNIKRQNKIVKVDLIILYCGFLLFVFVYYQKHLFPWVDEMVDKVLRNIYFPSFPFFLLIMLLSLAMILWIMIKGKSKLIQRVSAVFFSLMQFFLLCFLGISFTTTIDYTSRVTMYLNPNIAFLFPLSIKVFSLWLLVLFLIWYLKHMRGIIEKQDLKKDE